MRSSGSRPGPFAPFLALAGALLPFAMGAMITGCGPFIEVIKVDQFTAEKLKTEILVYSREQLKGVSYKVVVPLEATSCKQKLWDDPATEQDATNQLRSKARTAQANGIMNVTCFPKERMNTAKNCWQSIICNGIGIQVSQ